MEQSALFSLRDRLIAAAAFAYALHLLHEAGVYVQWTVDELRWSAYPWFAASDVVATISLLGQFAGFVVVGTAFAGRLHLRAGRVRLGAYFVGGAYILMLVSPVLWALDSHGLVDNLIQPDVVTMLAAYVAASAAAWTVASAHAKKRTGASPKMIDRKGLLGWASVCFGASVALTLIATRVGDGFYALTGGWVYEGRDFALYLVANVALVLGALLAAYGFFRYHRTPDWAREARHAKALAISSAPIALYGVIAFSRSLTSSVHQLPSHLDSWLVLLAGLAVMVAGFCLSLAYVLACRAVPASVSPESIPKLDVALPECPSCGSAYNPADYREDAPVWLCGSCHASLRSLV